MRRLPPPDSAKERKRWQLWIVAAVVWCALVLLLNVSAAHAAQFPTSDQASVVLEGQSLADGNLLLHRWSLSLDSFWTSEVPFYGVASLFVGVNRLELTLVPAAIGAFVVGVAILISADGRRRAAASLAGAAVLAFLALPVHALARFTLVGGAHVGALLWSLIAFYALRKGRWGIGVIVAALSLALGMLGDLLTVAYGTAPVLLAGVLAMLRCRSSRSGLPAVTAAVGAVFLARSIRALADLVGTFSIGGANALATRHQIVSNLRHMFTIGGALLGVHNAYGTGGAPSWLQETHIAGAVLVVACALLYVVRLLAGLALGPSRALRPSATTTRPSDYAQPALQPGWRSTRWWQPEPSGWQVEDMLFVGAIGGIASYVMLASSNNLAFARYLTAAVVFLVVLAARTIGRGWDDAGGTKLRTGFTAAALALVVLFAADFTYTLTSRVSSQPAVAFARWLETRHLTNGVGAYWASNIVTVASGDAVHVRPVKAIDGKLRRYGRESTAAWYTGQEFSFVVYNRSQPAGGVSTKTAIAACGPLAETVTVDGYVVFVCLRPFTISASSDVLP